MLHNFSLLPIELQQDIVEMRAAGMAEDFIDRHVGRILAALELKSNKVQVDVWNIEESLQKKLDQIGTKLQADLHTQNGATNAMLIELRASQMTAHPQIGQALAGVTAIQKINEDMELWVHRLETAFVRGRDYAADERARLEQKIEGLDGRLAVVEQVLELVPKADR